VHNDLREKLPPDWEICDYYHVADGGQALERPASVITCICVHPDDVTASEESIAFDRLITISNFMLCCPAEVVEAHSDSKT